LGASTKRQIRLQIAFQIRPVSRRALAAGSSTALPAHRNGPLKNTRAMLRLGMPFGFAYVGAPRDLVLEHEAPQQGAAARRGSERVGALTHG
jgi:hypothetical protein